MQISRKWINELVDIEPIKLEDLIATLTLGGFEVEEVFELEINNTQELILDISATANRSDSLSVQGIAAEIGTLLNKPLKSRSDSTNLQRWKKELETVSSPIANNESCSMYFALVVDNLVDCTTPAWLQEKLLTSGMIPQNNFLDFQNYIGLETGYPFVFYDFEKIIAKMETPNLDFSISKLPSPINFWASNDTQYKLKKFTDVIQINEVPISIAGIIEKKEFMCSKETKSILIEGSIWNAAQIRQQSRDLGIRTEQSARHEKSLKNTYLIEAMYRLLALLRIQNPNLTCRVLKFFKMDSVTNPSIVLRQEKINEILGPIVTTKKEKEVCYISPELIHSYLTRLNFSFSYEDSTFCWKVQIPELRSEDITREIDLIEEIGRLHGFNNFVTTLPNLKQIGIEDLSSKTRKKITACFLNFGWNEFTHYSLVPKTTVVSNSIPLINPLLSDCANLRSSLLPNLIQTVEENFKQGNAILEGFEYGHVFSTNENGRFEEKENVAGIFGGKKIKGSWTETSMSFNWLEAKGKLEQFFEQLNLTIHWTKFNSPNCLFHSYKTSALFLPNGTQLGLFGQISPILASQRNIHPNIYLFEFDLKVIQKQIQENQLTMYQPYVSYPKIVKDISFIIHQDIAFAELEKVIYANGTHFLSEIHLLDEYRGKSIPEQHISLCIQLVFQSRLETLQTKEIEKIIQNLESLLTEKFQALLRV